MMKANRAGVCARTDTQFRSVIQGLTCAFTLPAARPAAGSRSLRVPPRATGPGTAACPAAVPGGGLT